MPASASSPRVLWDFDGSKLINAITLLWLPCLVPRDPLGANLPFTIALFAFVMVAMLNHLFPERLHFLTHVVKALYSVLLVLSTRVSPIYALPLVAMDLAPLGSRRLAFAESLGAACRVGLVFIGFSRIGFSPGLWIFYAVTSAVYFVERRARIRRGRRFQYGWFHHFEHLALVAFLFAANTDRYDVHEVWIRLAVAPGIVFALLTLGGLAVNLSLKGGRLPEWFDRRVEAQFRRKLDRNVRSTKLYNYFFKPFDHALTLRKVTWQDIEAIVDATPIEDGIDEVVGVLSGGGFIASYVAHRNGIARVSYIRSSYWSGNDMVGTAVKAAKHLLGREVASELEFPSDFSVENKVVLLVDDTICTGATTESIRAELYRRKARRVIRYALFSNPAVDVEYPGVPSAAPLIWPWGWESD